MTEPTNVAAGGVAAAFAALVWWVKRQVKRIDDHEKRMQKLEVKMLTKTDLDRAESRLHEAITSSQSHVAERLGDVKATAERAHERIDDMQRAARRE